MFVAANRFEPDRRRHCVASLT